MNKGTITIIIIISLLISTLCFVVYSTYENIEKCKIICIDKTLNFETMIDPNICVCYNNDRELFEYSISNIN